MSLELESRFVKRGLWTNLEQGPVLGKTITTDTRTGNLMVALLAILSTLGTAHLWHLIAFAIHQIRANGHPADALFRQQQALLRSLPTPSSVMIDMLKLWWVWRKRTDRPFLRSIALVLLALIFAAATIAASVFSSLVVDSGTIPVLVNSPLCGRVSPGGKKWQSYKIALDRLAPSYAKNCYQNGTLPSSACNVFMHPSVSLKVQDVPCPFNSSVCDTKEAVSIDSGLVDIVEVFGLNLPAKDKIRYRRKTTCTILPTKGHSLIYNASELANDHAPARGYLEGEQFVTLEYGQTEDGHVTGNFFASLAVSNTTGSPTAYGGRYFYTSPNNTESSLFKPINELINLDGDTLCKPFIAGSITYSNPIDDPLYSAHQKALEWDDTRFKYDTVYTSDDRIKGIGCLQQFQYCHARSGKDDFCTPLQGKPDYRDWNLGFAEASDVQRTLLQLITFSTYLRDIASVRTLQANSQIGMADVRINSLPNDQWKREITGWEKEIWAGLQIMVSQYAIGPKASDPLADNYWIRPETEAEKILCQAQKMKKSGEFVNINVFGLSFVVGFSLLVALLDITLLKFLIFLSRFRRAIAPRIDRWTQDGIWQLQRRAYEGEGHRDWINLEKEIPLTDNGRKLKDLPILWLPGKSPAALSTETFSSTSSINSRPTGLGITTTHGQDGNGTRAKRGFGFLRLWRR